MSKTGLRLLVVVSFIGWCQLAKALPPLGLTHVGSLSEGNLEIIAGSAYIGAGAEVTRIDSSGDITRTELTHPELGTPNNVTRVADGPDGNLYVGANFGPANPVFVPNHAALFRLDEPTVPVVTWDRDVDAGERPWILGVDSSLRAIGNVVFDFSIPDVSPDISAAEFHLDGSIELLNYPADAFPASVMHVSPSGYALGEAHIPGTLGSGVALWSPSGSFSFAAFGTADSMRDRLDGQGVNFGANFGVLGIKYGDQLGLDIDVSGDRVIVSHSEFALVEDQRPAPLADDYFAFFPGIVPDDRTQAVPLFDIFPELASVNFDRITDLAAVDGRVYMTLVGEDGLYLFGARDPSVIPEPSALVIAVLATGAFACWRRTILRRRLATSSRR
jgi:hypothetical protein